MEARWYYSSSQLVSHKNQRSNKPQAKDEAQNFGDKRIEPSQYEDATKNTRSYIPCCEYYWWTATLDNGRACCCVRYKMRF